MDIYRTKMTALVTSMAHTALLGRYLISGGVAAATNLGLTALLAWKTELHYLVIVSVAFVASVVVSFSLQKFFTFREHRVSTAWHQLTVFFVVACVNLTVNDAIVYVLVGITETAWLVLDQMVASGVVACYSFFLYRYGVFKQTPEQND